MVSRPPTLDFQELTSAIVRDPLTVSPETTVIAAIAQMSRVRSSCEVTNSHDLDDLPRSARSSCVMVVEDGQLVGILTERDVTRLSAQQQPLDRLVMRQVMAHPVITLRISAFTDLFLAINLFQQHHIRHLPILDEQDRLIGLVTHESLRQIARSLAKLGRSPFALLRRRLVQEVMVREVICATPESSMLAIAQLMVDYQVSSIVLVRSPNEITPESQPIPVGILTERDLVQLQALGLNLAHCLAATVMSAPVFTIPATESLWTVQQIMEQRLIRRLVVTGEQGELLGIVTQSCLLQVLNSLELYNLAEMLEAKVERLEAEKIQLLRSRTKDLEQQVEARTSALRIKAEREKLVAQVANRIRTSLHVQEVLDVCVKDVRAFLGCDRVLVYQFRPDWSGVVIAESVEPGWSAALGNQIQDSCFQQQATTLYHNDQPLIVNDIYTTDYADCHIRLLEQYQVKANLVVPIRVAGQLWGLLIGHQCADVRDWQRDDMSLLQEISVQLAIALQQAITHQQLQDELRERQQTEANLRTSEQRYASLAAVVPVGIIRTDISGNCVYVNDRWCQITGLTADQSVGEGWQQGLHPDDRDRVVAAWQTSVQAQRSCQIECRMQQPGGTVVWIYGQAVAGQDDKGQVIGYVGTIIDISDRKLSELKLAASEAQFQKLATTLPGVLYTLIQRVDGSQVFPYVSARASEMIEVDAADIMADANQVFRLTHPDDVAGYMAAVEQSTATMQPFHHEWRVVTPSGKTKWLQANAYPERLPNQDLRWFGVALDVTDRKQAEQDVQRTGHRLHEAQRIAHLGSWELDLPTNTLYWSDEVFRIFEINPQEFGASLEAFITFVHPDDRDKVQTAYAQSLQNRTPYNITHRLLMPDGRVKYVHEQCETLYATDGTPRLSQGTVQDITRLTQAQLELERLNTELEERVAHRTAQLQEQEAQLQDFLDSANDLIQSVQLEDGRFEYVNRAWRETLGYSMAEAQELTIFDVLRPDLHTHCREMMTQMQVGVLSKLDQVELTFLTQTRQEILLEGSINCRFETEYLDGKRHQRPVATRAIFRDITERKQAEKRLQDSEAKLQAILNFAPLMVYLKDLEGRHILVNQAFLDGFSWTTTDVIGKTNHDLFPPAIADRLQAIDQMLLNTGELQQVEEIIRLAGTDHVFLSSKFLLRDSHGHPYAICGMSTDISDRKQAENALRQSQQFIQTILDTVPMAVFWKDGQSVYLGGNTNAAQLVGVESAADMVGKTDYEMPWGDTVAESAQIEDRQVMESGVGQLGIVERLTQPDGSTLWVETNKIPLRDVAGHIIGVLGTCQDISDRKQAEEQLRHLSDRLMLALEAGAIGTWDWDLIHEATWDERMYEIYGLQDLGRPAVYQDWLDLVHPEDQLRAEMALQDAVRGERDFDIEFRIWRSDRELRWIRATAILQRDAQGNPIRMTGINQDITDRKQAEEAMQRQLAAIEAAIDGVAILQGETFLYLNQAHLDLFGYQHPEDLLGSSWRTLYAPEELARFEREIFPVLEHDRSWQGEALARRKDGTTFDEGLSLTLTEAGLLICVCRDISDRKQADLVIRQQAEQETLLREITQRIRQSLDLRTIFDTATQEIRRFLQVDRVAIFQFNPESGFDDGQFVSESVAPGVMSVVTIQVHDHCFGERFAYLYQQGRVQATEDIEKAGLEHCHRDILSRFQVRANLILPLLKGEELWGLLCVHQCSGSRKWQPTEIAVTQQIANQLAIAIQQASLFDQLQQELNERLQTQQTLTERNQQLAVSNEELARATRLKDEFLANMSHELRTPLNAILGMTEGLQEAVFGPITHEQIKALQTIERSGSHLLELINDILDVAKIESGQLELHCTPTALAPLCKASLAFIKQQALKKRIQLEIKLPPHLPDVLIDERRIRQVLINLLNNAVKFTLDGGSITLEVMYLPSTADVGETDFLKIAVRDTGIGIAPDHISKLFQPFIQIDSALNRQYTGTGLGLALVKRIVELHGGEVGLTSELGVGSCFTIDLPCIMPAPSAPNLEICPDVSPSTSRINPVTSPLILLAEDNDANISTVSSYLRVKGYQMLLAKNGEEAIALAQAAQPDLILMDIQMPGMDGLEAMQHIRRNPSLATVPIIALTALAMEGDRDRCLTAGASQYLSKPVKLKQLAALIHQLLGGSS